jgi:hypothetical protein
MTANGEAIVIRASAKTSAKPNMLFLAFFEFIERTGQGWRFAGAIAIARLQMVMAGRLQGERVDSGLNAFA